MSKGKGQGGARPKSSTWSSSTKGSKNLSKEGKSKTPKGPHWTSSKSDKDSTIIDAESMQSHQRSSQFNSQKGQKNEPSSSKSKSKPSSKNSKTDKYSDMNDSVSMQLQQRSSQLDPRKSQKNRLGRYITIDNVNTPINEELLKDSEYHHQRYSQHEHRISSEGPSPALKPF